MKLEWSPIPCGSLSLAALHFIPFCHQTIWIIGKVVEMRLYLLIKACRFELCALLWGCGSLCVTCRSDFNTNEKKLISHRATQQLNHINSPH
jgi:hypothetical protein